jgi:acetolactate synthase-1/2/3 large subunit
METVELKKPIKRTYPESIPVPGSSPELISMTGSQAFVQSLIAEGVDLVFGYPGGAIMPIYDALYDFQEELRHILVRHEQGAIHAAQGYARTSGKVGVCLATSGPGATNLITGIADAQIDSTPLVCITGQVASHLLGTDAFQESDIIGITTPITKWNYQITHASEIPEVIAKAFYFARSGRPGPVLIDITKDAQFGKIDYKYKKCDFVRSYNPKPIASEKSLREAAELINAAKKPYILAGHGILISGAERELISFSEKTGIPVANTLLGLSGFPSNHPNYVGYLGMHGNYSTNLKTNEADLIIAIGMRFDDRVTGDVSQFIKQAKVIHIEIDESEIHKIIHADVPVHSDAKKALEELLPLVNKNSHSDWIAGFKELDREEYDKVKRHELFPDSGKIKMAEAVHLISEMTQGQAIIVTDVGQHQMTTSRYYDYVYPHTNITSGGLGTMGFALPAAMGAKLGNPAREVIAIIGDGGFQMTLQEMATIYQSQIPVKIVILNNQFLGMVRQWQQLFFEKRYSSTDMINPDFVAIAKGFYLDALRIESREDLKKGLEAMIQSPKAFLLEIMVEKEENVFPMVPAGAPISHIRLE